MAVGGVRGCRGACVAAGGMHGCRGCAWLWGVCVVAGGRGMVTWEGEGCVGYDEIRSMSGRYASYWNAFLYWNFVSQEKWEP